MGDWLFEFYDTNEMMEYSIKYDERGSKNKKDLGSFFCEGGQNFFSEVSKEARDALVLFSGKIGSTEEIRQALTSKYKDNELEQKVLDFLKLACQGLLIKRIQNTGLDQ